MTDRIDLTAALSGADIYDSVMARPIEYILDDDGRTPIPIEVWSRGEQGWTMQEDRLLRWARWRESHRQSLVRTMYRGYFISTVFLGVDHAVWGPPVLWETMVFAPDARRRLDRWQARYRSYEEALKGHSDAVRMVRSLYGRPRRLPPRKRSCLGR